MTVPSPFTGAASWDALTLGGVTYRGAFRWGGDLIKRKLDHRHAAGRDGARVRDKGYDLAEVDLTLTVTNDDEWSDMQALVTVVFPRAATPTARNALACAHPALALAGISALYGTSMGPVTEASPTRYEVTLKFVEYRPEAQRNVSRSPRPAAPAAGLGNNATAFTLTPIVAPTPPGAPGPSASLTPIP